MSDQPTSVGMDFAEPFAVPAAAPPSPIMPPPSVEPPAPIVAVDLPPPPSPALECGPPSADEMAAGLTGLPAATDAAYKADAKPRRVVRFVESEREKKVPLAHPVECDGLVYDTIVVRRMNVADFFAHFAQPEGERGRFPCFFDVRGEAVPDEILDALSLDDSAEVNEAYQAFLPASFRAEPVPSSTPSNGEASPPS